MRVQTGVNRCNCTIRLFCQFTYRRQHYLAELHFRPFRLQCDQRQIFRMAEDEESDDDELVMLDAKAHSINLTHYIYECLRLALPIRPVHPAGQCDPEVVNALIERTTENEQHPDPRWDALRALKNE